MPPIRAAHPRLLANILVEGWLVFGAMILMTSVLGSFNFLNSAASSPVSTVAFMTVGFTICVQARRIPGLERMNLLKELGLVCLICGILGTIACMVHFTIFKIPTEVVKLLALEAAVAVPISVTGWRWISVRTGILDISRERVLILGTGELARSTCRTIVQNHTEFSVTGFAAKDVRQVGTLLEYGTRITTDFASIVTTSPRNIDRIIVALDEKRGEMPVKELLALRFQGIPIEDSTAFFERVGGKIAVESLLPSWLIFSDGFRISPLRSFLKRTVDLLCSTILLIVSSPVMAFLAVAIPCESKGGIVYRQKRLGMNGRTFEILKFRSMVQDAEKKNGPAWASERDPRITRIGRITRKLRLDELPQLFNVFRGEMSFIGPRPERPVFAKQLEEEIPYFGLRLTTRPGLTGWAQVQYGYGGTVEENREKLKYDLFYIKNCNLLLDVFILLKTIKVVLFGSGAR